MSSEKKAIRARMRKARQALSPQSQHLAATALMRSVSKNLWFRLGRCFACYSTVDGELGTQALIQTLWLKKKRCALPVLNKVGEPRLQFREFEPHSPRQYNTFGILEPKLTPLIPPYLFDVIFLPLVAFDTRGNRLGMGAGYYDRTLAAKRLGPLVKRPILVGLAYDFQQVDTLPCEPWDVRLDAVCTPTQTVVFR